MSNKYILKIISVLVFILIFQKFYPKIRESFSNQKNKIKISVVLMLKNNEFYVKKLNELFGPLENDDKYDFTYFIYENNSTDFTKESVINFLKNRKGKVILENLKKPGHFGNVISKDRGIFMANLRNKLKYLHEELDSDYTLLLDSDVIFNKNVFDNMISHINNENVMITPYSIAWNSFINGGTFHYYDTLALITNEGISYKHTKNTCLFPNCKECKNSRKKYGIKIDPKYMIKDSIIKVKSAFAGFCLIKTDVYNKVNWGGTICEHHSFCKKVRKYGNILLLRDVKTTTLVKLKKDSEFSMAMRLINKLN